LAFAPSARYEWRMEPARGAPAPISFFAHASLAAGWYLAWRLTVFTAPFWLVPAALAAAILYPGGADPGPELALLAAGLVALGLIAAFVASIRLTNRVASGWAVARWGRALSQGVWWGIFWRVAVIGVLSGVVIGAVEMAAAAYAALKPWSPEVLFVTMIPYAVILANVVVTLRSYGWAMSTMVARRLNAASPPAAVPAIASVAPASLAPAAAPRTTAPTAAAERLQCPKCGLRETERGQVIGWHCKVCGWRETPSRKP
jgi:hypothetical protein